MSHLSCIARQARLGFVLEGNGSKYCQAVDNFAGLPMGVCMESAAFWVAVREGGKPALQ